MPTVEATKSAALGHENCKSEMRHINVLQIFNGDRLTNSCISSMNRKYIILKNCIQQWQQCDRHKALFENRISLTISQVYLVLVVFKQY